MTARTISGTLAVIAILALVPTRIGLAMPPHPDQVEAIAHEGSPLPYALEHRAELVQKGVDSPYLPGPGHALSKRLAAGREGYNLLCILVEFVDMAATVNASDFDSLLFAIQPPSVRHYYKEVSYGSFDIVTVNMPSATAWQTVPSSYAYYCNAQSGLGEYPQNCQKLAEDLVLLVDPVVDFSNYDNDGDGYVDGFTIVHAGKGAEAEHDPSLVNHLIWSHKWNTSEPMTVDGKEIYIYTIQPEFILSSGDATIGVYCHELGHSIFGLPDLYDSDYSSNGLGSWSVMSVGSWNGPALLGESPAHPDAWCRVRCGFAMPAVVSSNQGHQAIANVESNDDGLYVLWNNGVIADEYFLIENRQPVGYDAYLPAHGLLIYHVDESVETANDNEWYVGYQWNGHYLVALEQADNLYQLEKSLSYGDYGDPFPGSYGRVAFSSTTSPGSDAYSGQSTLVAVNNISGSGTIMYADLLVALAADVDNRASDPDLPGSFDLGQNYPNPFNSSTQLTFTLPVSASVRLCVYNVSGQLVATILDQMLAAGRHQINWTASDRDRYPLPSGVYFYRLQTDGAGATRKMMLLR